MAVQSDEPTKPDGPTPSADAPPPTLVDELAKMPYEPLLPIEKKLIVYSLVLGTVLLAVLAWLSFTFFEV